MYHIPNLRSLRAEGRISQYQLARSANVSTVTISRIENDLDCQIGTAQRIISALNGLYFGHTQQPLRLGDHVFYRVHGVEAELFDEEEVVTIEDDEPPEEPSLGPGTIFLPTPDGF